MNRSILIVICDFLLVSLVTFSTLDLDKVQEASGARDIRVEILTNQVSSRQDLGEVMKIALEEERRSRDLLAGELAQTRDSVSHQKSELQEREKQIDTFKQQLQSSEQKGQLMAEAQAKLQTQIAEAQSNIQNLNKQLQSNAVENVLTKEKLAATESEARQQLAKALSLQQQLGQLERSNELALGEQQKLNTKLQVAEAEKRIAAEKVAKMMEEVKIEKEEKARLAEVANKSLDAANKSHDLVKTTQELANKSQEVASKSADLARELKQEFHDNQPLAANIVFNAFVTNRVHSHFTAYRPVFLGIDSNKRRDSETVLVTDGTNTFALCHVQDTALTFWTPGTDWEALTGTLTHDLVSFPIPSISFYLFDPRVVLIPLTKTEAKQLGGKPYQIAADPLKFPDAVVVGTRESYYGEVKFQIEFGLPQYLKMDRNTLKGVFGKFNPSSGDLVLSKTGELLGVMANNSYCIMLKNLNVAATIQFGLDLRGQRTGQTLSLLHSMVQEQPLRVQ